MHALTAFFTRNAVAANLLMLLLVVAGVFTATGIRIEGFPALPANSVTVTTILPGADAEQVDRSISSRIEKALEGMSGVKKIAAGSTEGFSAVWVQKSSGTDMDRFENDIKTRIDAIAGFPQAAERPVIARDEFTVSALLVQVYGLMDEDSLQQAARMVREELLAAPEISKIQTFGQRPHEVRVEVDTHKVEAFGLSMADIGAAINRYSLDYKSGTIDSAAGRIIVRADQKAFHLNDFIDMPVRVLPDGTRLLLKDVAAVVDGFEEKTVLARFQGQPSVGMLLYTTRKGDLLAVSRAAHQVVDRLGTLLPAGIKLDTWGDSSIYMQARLALLRTNAWQGLLIVFGLLALFLNLKLAFWVAMGIPISIAGALAVMGPRFLDYSLNDITTFGLIVVLGILVDDAVVVGESVFEERSRGGDPIEGTLRGVSRVTTATVFGCFTTVAAFYPPLLIDNDLGRLFASFSVVVIVALLFSLLESKLILPAHLARISLGSAAPRSRPERWWTNVQQAVGRLLDTVNQKIYQPVLARGLRHRYTTLIIFVTLATLGIGMMFNGKIRTVFFPEVPGDIITVKLKMNDGSPPGLTLANLDRIEQAARELNASLMATHTLSDPPIARLLTALTDATSAEFYAELQPEENRAVETMQTLRRWRESVGTLEGAEELTFSGSLETGGGFMVEVAGRDPHELQAAVGALTDALGSMEGVFEVRDDLRSGGPQLRLQLKPAAAHLGVTAADLARQVGDAFGGLEIQRMQRQSEEVKVIVKYDPERRRYLSDLFGARIRTAEGRWLPLPMVATIASETAPGSINRREGRRAVLIKAHIDKRQTSASEVFAALQQQVLPRLNEWYPGITVRGAGELEEMGEMKAGLKKALIMILLLIYALLAIPLKSYWQPLVIMSVVPFGFAGALVGHKIAGVPLSVLSFLGMLALTGVVVNDSLVMLTRFNHLREQGLPLSQALIQAGSSRFRAIFLTTVTTVAGLMPLLAETSEQAQYLIPAAVSLAYGELFATPITLILIPTLIQIGHDARGLATRLAGGLTGDRQNHGTVIPDALPRLQAQAEAIHAD